MAPRGGAATRSSDHPRGTPRRRRDPAPRTIHVAPRGAAATPLFPAGWEATNAAGPGGCAVAVIGAEHVDAVRDRWMKTDPERIEALLAPPGVLATLGAFAAPLAATALVSALPLALPKRRRGFGWLGVAGLGLGLAINAASDRVRAYDRVVAIQAAVEGRVSGGCLVGGLNDAGPVDVPAPSARPPVRTPSLGRKLELLRTA